MNSSDLLKRKVTVDKIFADSSPFDDCAEVKEIPRVIYYPIELVEMQDRKSTLEKLREGFCKTKYRPKLMEKYKELLLERLQQKFLPGDIVKRYNSLPETVYKVIGQYETMVLVETAFKPMFINASYLVLIYRPKLIHIDEII